MRVGVAKDMATTPTVMSSFKEVEGFMAGRRVADDGVRVRFPMVSLWETFDDPEGRLGARRMFRPFATITSGCASAGRPPTQRLSPILTIEAVGAAVHTPGRRERRGSVSSFGRSQDGGDVEGQLWWSELPGREWEVGW